MVTKELKYVIVDYKGLETPIIFPMWMNHNAFKHMNPISAGMIRLGDEFAEAYGKSNGLGLLARAKDSELVDYIVKEVI